MEFSGYDIFYKDQVYYTLGSNVNIRKEPNTESEKIISIPINTPVKILNKTDYESEINGWKMHWYEVNVELNKQHYQGFIWGGLLATFKIQSKTDQSLSFLFGPSKSVLNKKEILDFYVQVRAVKDNKELNKLEFKAVGQNDMSVSFYSRGNKKLKGISEVLGIYFSGNSCGAAFGEVVLFWDSNRFIYVKELKNGTDAPYYYSEKLIYPGDKGGKEGVIFLTEESGYYDTEKQKDVIESYKKFSYTWNGESLIKLK